MVSGRDRRHARHEETARLILQAAWRLAERDGLAGLSLGELARAMEMRPQSLYTYFPVKAGHLRRHVQAGLRAAPSPQRGPAGAR